MKFYPYEKGGGGKKKLSHAEEGSTNKFWGKGERAQTVSDPRFSHFVASPPCN